MGDKSVLEQIIVISQNFNKNIKNMRMIEGFYLKIYLMS